MSNTKIPMEKEIYKQLTEEIMYNNSKQDTYTNYAYFIVAAVWTATFTSGISWLVLIPLIILLPISFRIADSRYSIALISSYIKNYLDPKFSINWQTKRMKYNEKYKNKRIIYHGSKFDIPIMKVICIGIFWFMRYNQKALLIHNQLWYSIALLVIQVVIILFDFFVCLKYSNMNKMKKELINNWNNL